MRPYLLRGEEGETFLGCVKFVKSTYRPKVAALWTHASAFDERAHHRPAPRVPDVIVPIVNPKYQTCLIIVQAALKTVQAALKVYDRSVKPPVRHFPSFVSICNLFFRHRFNPSGRPVGRQRRPHRSLPVKLVSGKFCVCARAWWFIFAEWDVLVINQHLIAVISTLAELLSNVFFLSSNFWHSSCPNKSEVFSSDHQVKGGTSRGKQKQCNTLMYCHSGARHVFIMSKDSVASALNRFD